MVQVAGGTAGQETQDIFLPESWETWARPAIFPGKLEDRAGGSYVRHTRSWLDNWLDNFTTGPCNF